MKNLNELCDKNMYIKYNSLFVKKLFFFTSIKIIYVNYIFYLLHLIHLIHY